MGIKEVITAPRSPWQNPYVERIIGSIRRECLNHVIIFDERHLRRALSCVDGAPLASSFFLDAIWSGAVMCPACWCGAMTAGPDVVRRPGPYHRIALA